ncbi:MAG: hypothetical protein IPN85_18910 [Flavobacteriales bacterium]|nr:hypothetical protein [Flavobacteriales bacterium]
MLLVLDLRIDTDGQLRSQLMREDIPLTPRLRLDLMGNSDLEYMAPSLRAGPRPGRSPPTTTATWAWGGRDINVLKRVRNGARGWRIKECFEASRLRSWGSSIAHRFQPILRMSAH